MFAVEYMNPAQKALAKLVEQQHVQWQKNVSNYLDKQPKTKVSMTKNKTKGK